MTETEILKAAECCKDGDCVICPLSSNRYENKCKDILFEAVIDFMNGKNEITTETEMTEAEIMKALECCKKDDCDSCPNDFGNCYANLAGFALDLINRKNAEIHSNIAEIERLKMGITSIKTIGVSYERVKKISLSAALVEKIRAEAIKNLVEQIHRSCAIYGPKDKFNKAVFLNIVDQIAKEMGV